MIHDFTSPNLSRSLVFDKPATVAAGGVVASHNRAASEVGAQVLRDGGNAVDAAVATAFALTVVEPWMSGLGGGGAMLVYSARSASVKVVDFALVSPRELDPASYPIVGGQDSDLFGWPNVLDNRNVLGAPSVAVPGLVRGLALALSEFGSRGWAELMRPAIELARKGLEVDWYTTLAVAHAVADLQRFPASAADFLRGGQAPVPVAGTPQAPAPRLPRERLLATMERLAEAGPDDFYAGEIAASMVADLRSDGGSMSMEDLRSYRAAIADPAECSYRGQRVCVAPRLNGGPTLLAALRDLSGRYTPGPSLGPATFVAHAASLQGAWRERLATLGDHGGESCTTHLSVVDAQGNIVALTQTLLSIFGSRLTLPQSGLLMNNGIMWFDPVPGRPNSIGAGKRPLANFCPALLLGAKGNHALGGSGGRKILPAVLSIISFIADHGLSLGEAVSSPRIDVSGNPWVTADSRLPPQTLHALEQLLPVVRADRTVLPIHFTIASGVADVGGRKLGAVEPGMPWGEAVGVA